jgi:hypothetical protein
LLLVFLFLLQGLGGKGKEKTTIKQAGLWLKNNGFQGSVVMGPKEFLRLAFYADGKFVEMPDSWEKAIESIRKNGVRIVVIDSCTVKEDFPGLPVNWSQDVFLLIGEIKELGKNCFIQIYSVP